MATLVCEYRVSEGCFYVVDMMKADLRFILTVPFIDVCPWTVAYCNQRLIRIPTAAFLIRQVGAHVEAHLFSLIASTINGAMFKRCISQRGESCPR
jgi:hypothetical protein